MNTRIVRIRADGPDGAGDEAERGIREAADVLRAGGLVAFPTETVYGLGANIYDEDAFHAIYRVKGRPSDNPLIVHIAEPRQLGALCAHVPKAALALAERYWPGPLTLILDKNPALNAYITAGLDTVAVRLPAHPTALALLAAAGVPVAAPSANLSGKPSPTRGEHVIRDLDGKVDMIIDAGPVEVGLESTVLDMTRTPAVILRPGAVTREDIAAVIGAANVTDGGAQAAHADGGPRPISPGQKYRHYAPDAPMVLLKGSRERVAHRLRLLVQGLSQGRGGVSRDTGGILAPYPSAPIAPASDVALALLASDELLAAVGPLPAGGVTAASLGAAAAPELAAARLYDALRGFDAQGAGRIYCEYPAYGGIGRALRDRMTRAAAGHIVDADDVRRVLFVCTGNTCRSAMAEALFNAAAATRAAGITDADTTGAAVHAGSAGLMAAAGEPASPEAAAVLQNEYDADLSGHAARPLTPELLAEADLVLTMTRAHKAAILAAAPYAAEPARVFTLAEFAGPPAAGVAADGDVPDPYGSGERVYRECAAALSGLVDALVTLLCPA